jgi:5-methyltetrahydropteroyltriglutamate--homocysteine methyltransferase
MPSPSRPPFRADHVGSLLRPDALHAARTRRKAGEIDAEELRVIEDRCIRDVVRLQEDAGLQGVTDGEFRRAMWHTDFLTGFDGIEATGGNYAVTFKGEHGEVAATSSMLSITGKVRRTRPIMVDHFRFLKSVCSHTPKFCIPSATYLHMRGGRKVVSPEVYPDMDEFWADVAAAYQAEIADLAAAGCTYLQIDDVSFAFLCDQGIREQVRRDGEDPDALPGLYARIINSLIAKRPAGMSVTVHTCRGNHKSMWMAEGGYEAIAEAVFGLLEVDGIFLEYDSDRAGGFEPLRHAPKGKRIVLGLVSTKLPALESKDVLKRRIEEAAKFVDIGDLCISPQCGFASTEAGNELTEDDERRKLELLVQVAEEVWGGL